MAKKTDDEGIARAVEIDPTELEAECCRVPSAVQSYGSRAAIAHSLHRKAKAAREKTEASFLCDPEFEQKLIEKFGKAPTAPQRAASILLEPEFNEAMADEIEADTHRLKARWDAKAIEAKSRMVEVLAKLMLRDSTAGKHDDREDDLDIDDDDDDDQDDDSDD